MVAWKHKSDEEKKRIHDEIRARELAALIRFRPDKGGYRNDAANKKCRQMVIDAGNIPLFCPNHGWVGADEYFLTNDRGLMVSAKCTHCSEQLRKYINDNTEEIIIMTPLLEKLKKAGRIIDRTKGK